jgi:hypothetical protein
MPGLLRTVDFKVMLCHVMLCYGFKLSLAWFYSGWIFPVCITWDLSICERPILSLNGPEWLVGIFCAQWTSR